LPGAAADTDVRRLCSSVVTFNSLPGVAAGKALQDQQCRRHQIWDRIRDLGEGTQPEPEATKPAAATAKPKPQPVTARV
jgi:hypothetical protein